MKILMRTHMWPEGIFNTQQTIAMDRIGSNIGNMLFPYSVGRWVLGCDEEISIDPIRDSEIADLSAKKINEEYGMLLLPFANAFRKDFAPMLRKWAAFIRKLNIPCVVIGIGAQSSVHEADKMQFDFDKDVLDFCEAVLEKSDSIGVRGEFTKNYLVRVGVPEDCITVIGCPSMFVHGRDFVKIEKKPFEELKKFSFNTSKRMPGMPIVKSWMEQYPDSEFIPQETWELILLYIGYEKMHLDNGYFVQCDHDFIKSGRVHSFVDTMSWVSYLHNNAGLSAGTRIHGNIAALMSGVPALVIAGDSRVMEICNFYKIPCRTLEDMQKNTSLRDWYEEADYNAMNQRYPEALAIYEQFFEKNKIPHRVPDKRLEFLNNEEIKEITAFESLSKEEMIERINLYCPAWDDKADRRDKWRQGQTKKVRAVLKKERDSFAKQKKEFEESKKKLETEKTSYKEKYDRLNTMKVSEFIQYKIERRRNRKNSEK